MINLWSSNNNNNNRRSVRYPYDTLFLICVSFKLFKKKRKRNKDAGRCEHRIHL